MTANTDFDRRQLGALLAGFALAPATALAAQPASGTAPTGTAPTGTAPTGTAPTGPAPNGALPGGTVPTGSHDGNAAAPSLTFVFDLDVVVAAAQELGELGGGRRRVIPITGGSLRGPGLNGHVLPGGADWQTLRPDGLTLLQARYTVQMDDGAVIGIVNTGVRRASPEVARRLAAGETVDPSLYYFRASPVFEVGPGAYQWLVENLFVSVGQRLPELVRLKVYRLG